MLSQILVKDCLFDWIIRQFNRVIMLGLMVRQPLIKEFYKNHKVTEDLKYNNNNKYRKTILY